jgi:Glycosyl transferase family 11.
VLDADRPGITRRSFALRLLPGLEDLETECLGEDAPDVVRVGDDVGDAPGAYEALAERLRASPAASAVRVRGFFQKYGLMTDEAIEPFRGVSRLLDDGLGRQEDEAPRKEVAVHVRRGDYVSLPAARRFHGVLGRPYVRTAMTRVDRPFDHVHVFSDDPDWCASRLRFDVDSSVVPHASAGEQGERHLARMASFDILLIANSSFSWWAARLAEARNPDVLIVAPGASIWFRGKPGKSAPLIPNHWRSVEAHEVRLRLSDWLPGRW